MSQKTRVKNRISEVGYVDNFWAIENRILRLGSITHALRAEGINLTGAYGKELGKERAYWKNYYYTKVVPFDNCLAVGCSNLHTKESPLCAEHLNRQRTETTQSTQKSLL